MAKVQQTLEMPNELHEKLKERARQAGLSLQDYVLAELERVTDGPADREIWEHLEQPATRQRRSREEVIEGLRALSSVRPDLSSADVLREARDDRERDLP